MGHMSISHVYRQFVNDASLVDITGVLCPSLIQHGLTEIVGLKEYRWSWL